MKTIPLAAFALLAAAVAVTARADDSERAALQSLEGVWASAAPEPWCGGFGVRRFTFSDGSWSLDFQHALDPAMTRPTFRLRTGGAYRVGEESALVAGAYRTVFGEEWKRLTRLTDDPALVEALGLAPCALPFNLEADISERGCAAWRPVAVCGEDHDLLRREGDGLAFGVRPRDNDMCSADRTPTALLPPVPRFAP